MITVKITAGGKSTVQGTGKWSYAWINNAGETAIYATTEWGTQTVTERIAEYEAGGAKDIVKLPAGSSKRLRANNRPVVIFGAEAGMAEVDLTNTDVSPFKSQAKGGDDGKIESLSVTENGTYTASGEVKGYSPVTVDVQPNLGTKNISDNGTYTASADELDGYSAVTVTVSKDYYPKAGATLDDVTHVEADDQRVLPMAGADYYPYVYLGSMPYPAQQGDDFVPCGKQYNGQTQEHTVALFFDLIDTATGESVTGYPQRIAPNWAVSIVNGGYMKVVSWTVKASGAVSVVTERYNPTYTKPLQDTHDSAVVTGGKLDAYLDTSYYIDGGAGESVLLQSLTATANGTYTAPARTAYNEVTVDVQEQPWQPLEDGYSNFWFELTDDTLSPWLNFSAKNNDAVIDWGDGSGEVALDTLTPTHTYARAGKYVVKVKGVTGIDVLYTSNYSDTDYYTFLKYVELNSDVVSIASYVFRKAVKLEKVVLNSGVILNSYTFQFCGSLNEVNLQASNSASSTYSATFINCPALTSVTLPPSIETIGTSMFYNCISLAKINIPASVIAIGNTAFYACVSLSEVHVLATTPPTLGNNVFNNLPSDWICYVPVGTGETYKAAAGWSTYADHILEEGQTVTRAMKAKFAKEVSDVGADEGDKR